MFIEGLAGKSLITRTTGTKIASEDLKGSIFEVSPADLNEDEDQIEDVQGFNVVTNFHGMDLTRDELCSLFKKWVTLIEANVDVKTTDGPYPPHTIMASHKAQPSISTQGQNCFHPYFIIFM